tara:strand:+ start:1314 stop:1592 length:279 start_codon:yes stop_codon:yes gene_type:complete
MKKMVRLVDNWPSLSWFASWMGNIGMVGFLLAGGIVNLVAIAYSLPNGFKWTYIPYAIMSVLFIRAGWGLVEAMADSQYRNMIWDTYNSVEA